MRHAKQGALYLQRPLACARVSVQGLASMISFEQDCLLVLQELRRLEGLPGNMLVSKGLYCLQLDIMCKALVVSAFNGSAQMGVAC